MVEQTRRPAVALPESGKRSVLVTSALPYVNNVPHLGNIIGSVLSADVFARFCRARGINTLFVGGNDEYGTTSEVRALQQGCTPRELCDKYHEIHARTYEWFNISFDIFGRTSTALQTDIAQDIFLKLQKNGVLQERVTTQLYCDEHGGFLADRFVEGTCSCGSISARGDQCDKCGRLLDPLQLKNPRCVLDGKTPVTRDSDHIFLELDKLQHDAESFFNESAQRGDWTNNAKAITAAWLRKGLHPQSITRDISWGTKVPLPGYEEKVFFSWFDACIGYVSITAQYTDQWGRWWRNPDVQLYQFMGKDNVLYHSVILPATLMGTREEWTKVHHLSATEYLRYEGGKFSKSRGYGVFGDDVQSLGVPADIWRFWLLINRPEKADTTFTWDGFILCTNKLLVNNVGNFINRVLKFVASKTYNSIVPDWTVYHEPEFDVWKDEVNVLLANYIHLLDSAKLRAALGEALHISGKGNGLLQVNKLDNRLREAQPEKCAAVVGLAMNLIHLIGCLIAPFLPDAGVAISEQLGGVDTLQIPDRWNADVIQPGHRIGEVRHVFRRINPEKAREWRARFGTRVPPPQGDA